MGTREVNDTEFFRMRALDGRRPHSGFRSVFEDAELMALLPADPALPHAEWGAVIEIAIDSIDLDPAITRLIPEGVTVRGWRRGTDNGPELRVPGNVEGAKIFRIEADHTRITALRLTGPTRSEKVSYSKMVGVWIIDRQAPGTEEPSVPWDSVLVDHVELSQWTDGAVNYYGPYGDFPVDHGCYGGGYPRPNGVSVIANFIHHNSGGYGYGVTSDGGFPLIRGNVFYRNKHSVTSTGKGSSSYAAHDNLVQSGDTTGPRVDPRGSRHSFDVHGSADPGHWEGGEAGDIQDVGWNTFLLTTRRNFRVRGTPCHYSYFHDNVVRQAESDAVSTEAPETMILESNRFSSPDPTPQLGVGDFDGDGISDPFLATGNTWWYSSGGVAEWRFLNRMSETVEDVLLGDFDGDGRTDVAAVHGRRIEGTNHIDVSWAGVSDWVRLTDTMLTRADFRVGYFDGDRRSDIFLADGTNWAYLSGGVTRVKLRAMAYPASTTLLADFNNDQQTDVFFVDDGDWSIVTSTGEYIVLQPALTASVEGLVAADFNGDGDADVARTMGGDWQISSGGYNPFKRLRAARGSFIERQPVGLFNDDHKADVIVWDGRYFAMSADAKGSSRRWSRQDMK